jgi:hypothetical protein
MRERNFTHKFIREKKNIARIISLTPDEIFMGSKIVNGQVFKDHTNKKKSRTRAGLKPKLNMKNLVKKCT